jgi:hypothetical protein
MVDDTDFEIERDMETDLADLRLTLAAYSDDPGRADQFDYVPTMLIYRVYCEARARLYPRRDPSRPFAPLTLSEFGVLLRRLFPRAARRKREYHGRQSWGYSHVLGPLAIRTGEQRGVPGRLRPKLD